MEGVEGWRIWEIEGVGRGEGEGWRKSRRRGGEICLTKLLLTEYLWSVVNGTRNIFH